MVDDPFEVLKKNRELLRIQAEEMKREELLEMLPQGHGSGLDADTVDGLHAVEIIGKGQSAGGGGGGSGESMVKHGNEWHNVPFAQKSCQVCEVDLLPGEDAVGHAVLLREDGGVYVCTEGSGEAPCGGCVFENVSALPVDGDVGMAVFLVSDGHAYLKA